MVNAEGLRIAERLGKEKESFLGICGAPAARSAAMFDTADRDNILNPMRTFT